MAVWPMRKFSEQTPEVRVRTEKGCARHPSHIRKQTVRAVRERCTVAIVTGCSSGELPCVNRNVQIAVRPHFQFVTARLSFKNLNGSSELEARCECVTTAAYIVT